MATFGEAAMRRRSLNTRRQHRASPADTGLSLLLQMIKIYSWAVCVCAAWLFGWTDGGVWSPVWPQLIDDVVTTFPRLVPPRRLCLGCLGVYRLSGIGVVW